MTEVTESKNWWGKLNEAQQVEAQRQYDQYVAGAEIVVPAADLREKIAESLATQRPLRIKLGLDPSAPDVHLGHSVVLNKLRQFQENGHIILLLIGDFTGRIGDPTGKSTARVPLTDEQVKHNAQTYCDQFGKVLNMDQVEVHYNATWLAPLQFDEIIRLAGQMTVARLLERDDFANRMSNNLPISLHEFFYPVMQGYDSVVLKSDIELGGTDQHYNILMGRHYQERLGQEKQVAILMPLLVGLDGVHKMSKSKHNYIGITETPESMYGKTMSLPDSLMLTYFELISGFEVSRMDTIKKELEDGSLHPRDAKMLLARTIVTTYHDEVAANQAEEQFIRQFQQKQLPDQITEVAISPEELKEGAIPMARLLVLTDLAATSSEARRGIEQGGVRVNGERWTGVADSFVPNNGDILQLGKRRFARLVLAGGGV